MTKFELGSIPPEYLRPEAYMDRFKVSYSEACEYVRIKATSTYYINDVYQVDVRPVNSSPLGPMIHLSIKRHDKEPIHDWRDLQDIKNELVGPENEAIEIYPAESRLVDMANQYHSWVFADSRVRVPVPLHLESFMAKTGPKPKPLAQRLWSKVDMTGGPESCWPFVGAHNGRGYGSISKGGDSTGVSPLYAHRVAFCLANGLDYEDLSSEDEVMHSCDNPSCCNPMHLSLGSSADNKADAISKGRMFWQKAQRNAKGQFESDAQDSEDD